jgi:hypothetical protein
MEPTTLAAMAVTEVVDLTIDFILYASTFTPTFIMFRYPRFCLDPSRSRRSKWAGETTMIVASGGLQDTDWNDREPKPQSGPERSSARPRRDLLLSYEGDP